MIKKLCCFPSCQEYAREGSIYCDKHYKESQKKRAEYKKDHFKNAKRYNQDLYNTYKWRQLRKDFIEKNPFCSCCGCCGSQENPLTVDHITPPKGNEDLFFDVYNLQVLCLHCHNKKTRYEIENI